MKKLYFVLLLAMLSVLPMMAHGNNGGLSPEKRKEYREYKMKFLAQEMGIKDDTKKKFFELYDELSDERHIVRTEMKEIDRKIKSNTASDEDYARLNRLKDQEAEIEKKYDSKFETFLTGKEIFKMKEAEKTFRKKLQEMQSKKREKRK